MGRDEATGGVANAEVARPIGGAASKAAVANVVASHDAAILFTFVLEGSLRLRTAGREVADQEAAGQGIADQEAAGQGIADQGVRELRAGDAFVVPPRTRTACERCSADLELLEVSLPGAFETTMHDGP